MEETTHDSYNYLLYDPPQEKRKGQSILRLSGHQIAQTRQQTLAQAETEFLRQGPAHDVRPAPRRMTEQSDPFCALFGTLSHFMAGILLILEICSISG
tara:strand:- start:18406 stop:18699 length:294 start_codon:yes stop_codon:yes gene_type:complete